MHIFSTCPAWGSQRHGTLPNIPFLKVISFDSSFGRDVAQARSDWITAATPLVSPYLLLSLSTYLLQVRPIFTKCRPGFPVPGTVPVGEGEHPRPTYRHARTGTISQAQPVTPTLGTPGTPATLPASDCVSATCPPASSSARSGSVLGKACLEQELGGITFPYSPVTLSTRSHLHLARL